MVEKKCFSYKSKASNRVSQCGEHDCGGKKNGDYYEYPSLSHLRMNFDYEENGSKRSFSSKPKASTSCIPMWIT